MLFSQFRLVLDRTFQSQQLRDLGIDPLGRRGRRPPVHDLAFLVDQELLKVPLRTRIYVSILPSRMSKEGA